VHVRQTMRLARKAVESGDGVRKMRAKRTSPWPTRKVSLSPPFRGRSEPEAGRVRKGKGSGSIGNGEPLGRNERV